MIKVKCERCMKMVKPLIIKTVPDDKVMKLLHPDRKEYYPTVMTFCPRCYHPMEWM